MQKYTLFHYFRSSCSWRVRLAFEYKKIPYLPVAIHLLNGESESDEYRKINPAGFVPALRIQENQIITESLAIIHYLEKTHPEAATLLPGSAFDQAKILALAETINAGTQPLQNLSVLDYLAKDADKQKAWGKHFIGQGLQVFESLSRDSPGRFSHGDSFSLADVCLIPQIYNANRFQVDLNPFVKIQSILSHIHSNVDLQKLLELTHPDQFQ